MPTGAFPMRSLAALEAHARRADAGEQARPQEEASLEPGEAPVVEGVDPDVVEVVDEERSGRRCARGCPRARGPGLGADRSGGSAKPGIGGRTEASAVFTSAGSSLLRRKKDRPVPAKALRPKRSLREREDRVVDPRVGQPDDPLDVLVAAADPEVPDRDAAGPERGRLVVVEQQRLGVRIDERAQPRAREQPAGRGGIGGQGQERGEGQDEQRRRRLPGFRGEPLAERGFQALQRRKGVEGIG